MLWWVIAGALFVASMINKEPAPMIASGIFAVAGSVSYVGSMIRTIFERRGDKDA
jgi:hypothetical protein